MSTLFYKRSDERNWINLSVSPFFTRWLLYTATGPDLQQSKHFVFTNLKLPFKGALSIACLTNEENDLLSFFLQSFPLQIKIYFFLGFIAILQRPIATIYHIYKLHMYQHHSPIQPIIHLREPVQDEKLRQQLEQMQPLLHWPANLWPHKKTAP